MCCFLFFFKQKTADEMRISDWSSDVCSSDLSPSLRARSPPEHCIGRLSATSEPLAGSEVQAGPLVGLGRHEHALRPPHAGPPRSADKGRGREIGRAHV